MNILTQDQLEAVKETISTELLKRGITAPMARFEEVEGRRGGSQIEFETEKFQTIPVMFKELCVSQFNTSLSQKVVENPKGQDYTEKRVWMTVYYDYRHFSGGTNGCEIFTFTAEFYNDEARSMNFQIR